MKNLLHLGFVFCFVVQASAQMPAWEEIKTKENINLEHSLIDSLGFLWGLNSDGLYKYDGSGYVLELKPDSGIEEFLTFSLDENHSIMIGSSLGKLIKFNPYNQGFQSKHLILDSLPISNINCTGLSNEFIITSYGNGLQLELPNYKGFVSQEDLLLSNEVYDVIYQNKEVMIASDQGIQILSLKDSILQLSDLDKKEDLLDVIVTNIISNENDLWVSYFADSLTHISKDSVQHFRFPMLGKIVEMKLHEENLFIASENGLFELKDGNLIQKYPQIGRMPVKDFDFDGQGNAWLINGKKKLLRASLSFQSYEINIPQIQAVTEVDGELWVGNKEGLFKIKNQGLSKILDQNITCLFYNHGYVWVGTFSNGFFILDKEGRILKNITKWQEHSNQSVLSMLITQNELYVSSLTGVVKTPFIINNDGIDLKESTGLNQLIGEGYYYQILEDQDRILFATDGKGILILEDQNLTKIDTFEDGSKIGSVYSITSDHNGRLWFSAATHGIGFLEGHIAYKRKQEKNNSDHYSSISTLSNGRLIMIRSGSIDILDPESNQILYFEKEVGLSDEPPYLNAIDISESRAIFSHNNLVYQYTSPKILKTNPGLLINSVLANLKPIEANSTLRQEENNIQFEYSASWLSNPGKLSYQYMLEGFDNTWRITKDRSVSYPKLNPGNYEFKIRASVDEDFEGGKMKTFPFKISRHFYNTWWFWVIISMVLGFLFTKWRDAKKRQLLAQVEIEKKHVETQLSNLKSQLNPHFLFNAFNTLMGLIEEDHDRSLSFVEKLTDFYRLVLEQGKNQLINIKEEFTLVNLYVNILNERFEQSLEISLPSLEDNILIPPLTLQLLIENAVKHNQIGGKNKLKIDIFRKGDYLIVRNNLSPKRFLAKSTGSGLNNIKKRYLLLNSKSIQIEKSKDFFTVKLPLIQSE